MPPLNTVLYGFLGFCQRRNGKKVDFKHKIEEKRI